MSDRDYYEALGLTPLADGAMIDQAYWHLARKYQSMAATHPNACVLLDELNEAYGVLGNARLRREYDAFRDDVLLASGAIQPVRSTPKRAKRGKRASATDAPSDAPRREFIRIPNWRWYGLAVIIAGLAFAGAWQGVNPVFVIAALAGGLALSLTPALKRQLPALKLAMPAMPAVTFPDVKAARLTLPRLPDMGPDEPDPKLDPDELRESTAAIIERWRKGMGLRAPASLETTDGGPSKTLVEIVEAERDLESESEPLSTVMEILRGATKTPAESEEATSR